MQNKHPQPDRPAAGGDMGLGLGLIGLAMLVIFLSRSIQTLGLGDTSDPGSKALPVGLAIMLGIGGAIELWQSRTKPSPRPPPVTKSDDAPAGSGTALIVLVGLAVYVIALPWFGFSLTTLVMASGMMVWLGNSWFRSILASVVLITIVYLLFVRIFKVPLPGGLLNLPF